MTRILWYKCTAIGLITVEKCKILSQNTICMNWNPTEAAWSLVWSKVCLNHNQCSVGKKHTHTLWCKGCGIRENGNDANHVVKLEIKPTLVYGRITQNLKLCTNVSQSNQFPQGV